MPDLRFLWNMARINHTHGLCPSCGQEVPRSVSMHAGVATETYRCPTDGARSYGPQGVPTHEWAAPSMATLRTMPSMGPQIDWITA